MEDILQSVGTLPILIVIVAVFGVVMPNFFTNANLLNITSQMSINIVLAAEMTFIILIGGTDLSVGSMLGTTAPAILVSPNSAWAGLTILAALAAGLIIGLFKGVLVYRFVQHLHRSARRRISIGGPNHGH